MAKTDPKLYQKYLSDEKEKKVLYLRLRKALYGMMKSALLFYRKLISELKLMGFKINPYDPCVANKTVNGTQMTVRWHIDDLMISHASMDDIKKFLQALKTSMEITWLKALANDMTILGWSSISHQKIK